MGKRKAAQGARLSGPSKSLEELYQERLRARTVTSPPAALGPAVAKAHTPKAPPPSTAIVAAPSQPSASQQLVAVSQGGPSRQDLPEHRPAKRASRQAALAAALDQAAALAEYESLKSANSAKDSRDTCLKTWNEFHLEWFGTDDAFPITVAKLKAVAAMFCRGRYRSYSNYLSRAKEHHVENHTASAPWDKALELEARKSAMAVLRGIGPARQSQPFNLQATLNALNDITSPVGAPVLFRQAVEAAVFWILREIELAAADDEDCTLNLTESTADLFLSASKTDPFAKGVHRSWGCVCNNDRTLACGYHAVLEAKEYNRQHFGPALPAGFPLFPNADGQRADKEATIAGLETAVAATGRQISNKQGDRLFGGHSFRVEGVQTLAALGIELLVIMCLSRHSSNIVLRYAQNAPLRSLTDSYKSLTTRRICDASGTTDQGQQHQDYMAKLTTFTAAMDDASSKLLIQSNQVKDLMDEISRLKDQLRVERSAGDVKYIRARKAPVHAVSVMDKLIPPSFWKTRCGWKFARAGYDVIPDLDRLPWQAICGTCLPMQRSEARNVRFDVESEEEVL
jgi:hypothetical protein